MQKDERKKQARSYKQQSKVHMSLLASFFLPSHLSLKTCTIVSIAWVSGVPLHAHFNHAGGGGGRKTLWSFPSPTQLRGTKAWNSRLYIVYIGRSTVWKSVRTLFFFFSLRPHTVQWHTSPHSLHLLLRVSASDFVCRRRCEGSLLACRHQVSPASGGAWTPEHATHGKRREGAGFLLFGVFRWRWWGRWVSAYRGLETGAGESEGWRENHSCFCRSCVASVRTLSSLVPWHSLSWPLNSLKAWPLNSHTWILWVSSKVMYAKTIVH